MNFTESQQRAIDIRDSSLIISAGAGSGKTAVLTERILQRICDENDDCNINDFLIVTFTNAAAKELSDRMRKKLSDKAKENPLNKKISKNIALLPLAKISTINAFCYEVVRNNFQKLGLSASLRIGDEAEMDLIKQRLMNEVIDEAFENDGDNDLFLAAYETFSSAKNDGGFVDTLLNLHRILSNIPDIDAYKNKALENYGEIEKCDEFFSAFYGKELKNMTKQLFEDNVNALDELISACAGDSVLVDKYIPALDGERDFSRQVLAVIDKGYESVRELLCDYKPKSLTAVRKCDNAILKDNVKNAKKTICDSIKDFASDYYNSNTDLLKKAACDTRNILDCLFGLVERFDKKLSERKNKSGIIEFSDAERYTLQLLVKSASPFEVTDLAKNMRESFKEIYIDEYQDVNPLQDLIFKALARHDEKNSEYTRFMVGDVKQSIYRFRGASPDIFLHYRNEFCDLDEHGNNKRIFMSHNFRCSRSVVEFSNYLFRKLMSEYYGDGDELVFGRSEDFAVNHKTELIISEYDKEVCPSNVSADMLEAAIICDKIKDIVGNPSYRDSDGKTFTYGDIAVLARSKTALKTYEAYFSSKGIPVYSDVGESFYGKKEILLCLSILQSVDNPMRDIPLAGFMRSFAGRFTDDELCIIRNKFPKMKLYNSVKRYALDEDGKCDKALSGKCASFIEELRFLRDYSKGKSASQLLWLCFERMGILNHCSSESFTNQPFSVRRNLLKLYEMALDFNKTSFRGVGAFIDYINASMKKDDIKAERVIDGECVRLMTVHASKGLEFPVCFVSDLARRFNKLDERQYMVFSQKEGFGCMLCDTPATVSTVSDSNTVRITTPYKKLISSAIDRESLKEEMRILYVALTRARDMLIMTGVSSKKISKLIEEALTSDFLGTNSDASGFLPAITSCIIKERAALPLYLAAAVENPEDMRSTLDDVFNCTVIPCSEAYNMFLEQDESECNGTVCEDSEKIDLQYLEKLEKLGIFSYNGDTESPAKLTVSMLKTGLMDDEMSDLDGEKADGDTKSTAEDISTQVISLENSLQKKIPDYLSGRTENSAAEKGTAMHMFMQFADYEACETTDGCKDEAKRLFERGFITENQLKLLEFERLHNFFTSTLYEEVKKSREIYREQRFNLEVDAFGSGEKIAVGKDILVQGVIDLFFENADGSYTVVDFKTDRVFGMGAEQTLIDRHKAQLSYYCKAVEEMTGKAVSKAVLYSFSLSKSVLCV